VKMSETKINLEAHPVQKSCKFGVRFYVQNIFIINQTRHLVANSQDFFASVGDTLEALFCCDNFFSFFFRLSVNSVKGVLTTFPFVNRN